MDSLEKRIRYCWICGKDITLEHSKTDEQGRTVHESCYEKRMLLEAASSEVAAWKAARPNRAA
jgi:hypothetical protein